MIFLSLSGIYEQQPELTEMTVEPGGNTMIDLTNMSGVTGYCSDEAAAELTDRIGQLGPHGIHFLDNGNFHYISSFFLRRITEPFELIVFDHHTDMQPPGLIPCLSCGSWVLESIKDAADGRNLMKRAVLIGPPGQSDAKGAVLVKEKAAGTTEDIERLTEDLFALGTGRGAAVGAGVSPEEDTMQEPLPVYVSVDKDILSEQEVKLNWDQGSMCLETLVCWIRAIGRRRRMIGVDICGEPLYNQFPDENVRKSEKINIGLADAVREWMK